MPSWPPLAGSTARCSARAFSPIATRTTPTAGSFRGPLDGNGRRSIYIKANLMEGPKFLSAFNFPGGKVAQGRRDVTNVPAQALALLNDPFVLQQADVWAAKLVARADSSLQARVEHLFRVALAPRSGKGRGGTLRVGHWTTRRAARGSSGERSEEPGRLEGCRCTRCLT